MAGKSFIYTVKHKLWHRRIQQCRHLWLRFQGMKMGKQCRIGKLDATFPNAISLGDNVIVDNATVLQSAGPDKSGYAITIGDRSFIGTFTHINAQECISIGNDCMIASGCRLVDNDHGYQDSETPMVAQACNTASIKIDDNVWLGTNVVVQKGVHIAEGSIVGSGAVVTKSIPPNEIWAGVPAKKIRNRFD